MKKNCKNIKAITNPSNQADYTICSSGTELTFYFMLPFLLSMFCASVWTVAEIFDLFVPLLLSVLDIYFLQFSNNYLDI